MEIIFDLLVIATNSGFFGFWGYMILLSLLISTPLNYLFKIINRTLRHRNISKHGYPPPYCDADGDFKKDKKYKKKEDDDTRDNY